MMGTYTKLLIFLSIVTLTFQVCPYNFGTTDLVALGSSTVTSTGATIVYGSVGVYPGTAIVGFPPGTTVPTANNLHSADSVAAQGQTDALTSYNYGAAQVCTVTYGSGHDLGGSTLTSGVYCFLGSAQITGTVTLDGQYNPNAQWIFKTASTLTTSAGSNTKLVGGAQDCQILWIVGSSATTGTYSTTHGNIVAHISITATTGSTVGGRLWALNGAVTMDTTVATLSSGNTTANSTTSAITLTCVPKLMNVTTVIVFTPPSTYADTRQSFICQNCSVTNTTSNSTTYTNVCAYTNSVLLTENRVPCSSWIWISVASALTAVIGLILCYFIIQSCHQPSNTYRPVQVI
jgi:hypothetical protein